LYGKIYEMYDWQFASSDALTTLLINIINDKCPILLGSEDG